MVLCVELHVALLNRLSDDSMSAFGRTVIWHFTVFAVKVGPMQLHNILCVTQCVIIMTIVQADRVFLFDTECTVGLLLHMEQYC